MTLAISLLAFQFAFSQPLFGSIPPAKTPTLVLVDKNTNTLHLAEYREDVYHVVKTFHTTVGKVVGDKQEEGDLKTPEGIYTFTSHLKPPAIKPKFGDMAFYMDYPNSYDQIAGRTGFDIMLHATDEPERLKKDYDSEGCIVLLNEEIGKLEPRIEIGLTPILVFQDMKKEYLSPGKNTRLKKFFKDWLTAWAGKDIDGYINSYHSEFSNRGMNLKRYRSYKNSLNKRYKKIDIAVNSVQYFTHPKYSVVMFKQDYRSTLKNGAAGYRGLGTKRIYVAEEKGQLKIISEDFTSKMW